MPLRRRSQARMLALQALCAYDAVGDAFGEQLAEFLQDEHVLADLEIDAPASPDLLSFARTLAQSAWALRGSLDQRLTKTAAHWSISRMTPVDRNILRLGLCELLEHADTPGQVVINEAVELAHRFGDVNSPGFVNGVLDAIRREIEAARGADSAAPDQERTESEHGAV